MRSLALLAAVLLAAVGVFLVRGLGQLDRLRVAHRELAERRAAMTVLQRTADLVPYEAYAALTERRARARALTAARRAALAARAEGAAPADLEQELQALALTHGPGLAASVRRQAEAGPEAEVAITAVLGRLPDTPSVTLESVELEDGGRVRPLAGLPGLREVRAQLVLTGTPDETLAALEGLAVERQRGLPAPSVITASLRRIEPDRWGPGLHRLAAPPVRLSVTLSVLLPFDDPGEG